MIYPIKSHIESHDIPNKHLGFLFLNGAPAASSLVSPGQLKKSLAIFFSVEMAEAGKCGWNSGSTLDTDIYRMGPSSYKLVNPI